MQDLIDDFYSINYKTTYDNHEEYDWPYLPWQTHIWYNLSIKVISCGALLYILFIVTVCTYLCKKFNLDFTNSKGLVLSLL
jgi:high-affinity nickel permease